MEDEPEAPSPEHRMDSSEHNSEHVTAARPSEDTRAQVAPYGQGTGPRALLMGTEPRKQQSEQRARTCGTLLCRRKSLILSESGAVHIK